MRSIVFTTSWNITSSTSPKSFYKTCSRQIMSSQGHSPTWNITFAISSKLLFECQECCKFVQMAFRHHETLLHPNHQSRILRRSEGRLWLLRTIRLRKISLNFVHVAFYDAQEMKLHCLSTPWIISSSTSPKSFFKMSRRQFMRS
jgi:hypothetical protein